MLIQCAMYAHMSYIIPHGMLYNIYMHFQLLWLLYMYLFLCILLQQYPSFQQQTKPELTWCMMH